MSPSSSRDQVFEAAHSFFKEAHAPKPFVGGQTYIPATTKSLDFEDLKYLLDASLDMWLTAGRYSEQLEKELPLELGQKTKGLLVNSGSSANLLAVSSLGAQTLKDMKFSPLQKGDEVITVAAGFPTTVNPIFQNHWKPVFVDVDERTLNATPELIMAAKTSKTRAVVLAHTLGNPYRADILADWCAKEGLYLIEDCCDALGAEILTPEGPRRAGSFGQYATLSFYPAHHMTTGEGGAVIAKDGRWRRVAESVRDWGRDCWCEPGQDNTCKKRFDWQLGQLPAGYDHKYIYSNVGYNLKMTDMQAAIGVSQLKKVPGFVEKRRTHWKALYDGIMSSPILRDRFVPVVATEGTNPSWFGFPLHCNIGVDRLHVTRFLESRKVGTRLLFAGNMTKQPAYLNQDFRIHGDLSVTDKIMNQTFWIGVHPVLTSEMITYILETLEDSVR